MLSALYNIVFPDVQLPISERDNNEKILYLKENDTSSKIKKLKISGLTEQSFAFTLDYLTSSRKKPCFKQLSSYLHPENQYINKGCDLVLFIFIKNKWYVLLLDLKSDRPRLSATEKQLQNSELFVKYICTLIQEHYPDTALPKLNYQKTYTCTSARIRKRGVYPACVQGKPKSDYLAVSVSVNTRQEASIHVGKLLGL